MQSKHCKNKLKCQIQIVIAFSGLMFVEIIYQLAESHGRDNHHHLVLGQFRVCWHPFFMSVTTQFGINKLKVNEGWKYILFTKEGGTNTNNDLRDLSSSIWCAHRVSNYMCGRDLSAYEDQGTSP